MVIKQFLNLDKKKINDESNKIVEKVAKAYNIGNKIYEIDEK